ncbi:hypothetical protein A4H97_32015 [Niastella yeongjuensis]|uniref:Uncharacterized protein n=1 Tax=Niastella yeongjuensis TaxID=354355 RepID=A0A1V9EIA8_9BACT|nr:hypothetical protein [Niastella yeongjuensis]OQP45870.1 hypothetical protein A4H97_32015 [Niastella yeongjuensis]SEP46711.1 hypothetical protein SAMN05660816_06486 [Niastella yeongjuensis]
MKKIKIMLTAVAVLAVVGGALAFKVKVNERVYCSNTTTLTENAITISDGFKIEPTTEGTLFCTTDGTQTDLKSKVTTN